MELDNRLYDLFLVKAKKVKIELLSIGLGYTAVTTSDGGIGLSCTFNSKNACPVIKSYCDYEDKSALGLLEKIKSKNIMERSMALALINALNYEKAFLLPEDRSNSIMFDKFDIGKGTKIAMVGFFDPLVKIFREREALVEIIDISRGIGQEENFYKKLGSWADALFLSSTSILNNTTEEILRNTAENVRTVMLGPSTPMVPDAFEHLPVHMLAGTVPTEKENVLKAVRHGMGTRFIHKFSRKSFCLFPNQETGKLQIT
ncbi:MAG: uncharacterized protein SRB1_00460 [Desulfobacteraceae bacterium Eth-SRB1]|nr:MAG: uncharacterized protein SRB1_00460 [Desulfobacteraceae bacterium Eth-SRB1]